MAVSSNKNKFTFTWKIQNFSMCVKDKEENLSSPCIFVEMLEKTEWMLQLYPKEGNTIENSLSCCLIRSESECSSHSITIDCSMTLVSVDNLLNITKSIYSCTFDDDEVEEFVFGNINEIFAKRDVLLPNDTLTIRCCMWRSDCNIEYPRTTNKEAVSKTVRPAEKCVSDETTAIKNNLIKHVYVGNVDTLDSNLSEEMYLSAKKNLDDLKENLLPNACTIRTLIACERRCKIWSIEKFNEIEVNDRVFTSVLGVVYPTSFILILYISKEVDGNANVHIDIQRNANRTSRCVVKCTITILNALFEDQDCIQAMHLFDNDNDIWRLPLIKKNELCKDQYLKEGSLFLRCEFVISAQDKVHKVEEIVSFPNFQPTANACDLNDWNVGLQRIRKDSDFSDVVLVTGRQSFSAHKAILCASSSYFKEILIEDVEETEINVSDFEPGIVEKFLDYMYSGILEMPLELECVMKLLAVAKELKVVALESQCSYLVRRSLDVSNVSEVLSFADNQKDELLKKAAMKFISEFPDEVFHSLKWKKFMEKHEKIAGETMYYVLTTKFVP